MVHSLLQLSEPCHILFAGRIKFASLEANLVGSFSRSHSFFLSPSGRSRDITEILLTGTLSLN